MQKVPKKNISKPTVKKVYTTDELGQMGSKALKAKFKNDAEFKVHMKKIGKEGLKKRWEDSKKLSTI